MSEKPSLIKVGPTDQLRATPQEPDHPNTVRLLKSGYGYGDAEQPDEFGLRDYWRMVRKHLWLMSGLALLFTTCAAIYMARLPDIYEARARVQVDWEEINPAFGPGRNAPVIMSGSANDPTYFNTQLQILSSPVLLGRAVKTLGAENEVDLLFKKASHSPSTWEMLLRMARLKREEPPVGGISAKLLLRPRMVAPAINTDDLQETEHLEGYIEALGSNLQIEPVQEVRLPIKETRLIDIAYTHTDARFAARVVNAIADTYVASNLELKTSTGLSSSRFLLQRIAELQSQIRQGEEALVSYAKNHQIISLEGSQNTVVERLAGLNRQLLEAENERKLAEAAYNSALSPGAADALAEGTARTATDAQVKLNDLRRQREQLLVEQTEKWPEVREIDRQITELERQIKEARGFASSTILTNLDTRYRQALAREQSLREAFDYQRGETVTQNESAINYRIKQQEIETNKELLNGLLQRSKESDISMAGTSNNVRTTSYAIVPRKSVAPHRMRVVAVAFALALGLGFGLTVLLEYMDDTLHSPEEVEKYLRLATLVTIPHFGHISRHQLSSTSSGVLQLKGGARTSPELLIDAPANSPLTEVYRHLRTSVLLSTAGHAPRTLLVTSSMPSEGKTTTATNIAISLAQTGAKVLLVDADMRQPRLHEYFNLPNAGGLSTCLSSEISDAEMLCLIEGTATKGLYVLSAGPLPPNPAELLGSEQMRRVLRTLEGTYTHVVIDSPPASVVTDAVLLSTMVDGVLLVVRHGSTSREVARRLRQVLQDVNAKVFGVVLNGMVSGSHKSYFSFYYKTPYGQKGEGGVAPAA
jgi:succinoglycan biosynthesis transport protein ExoP